MLLRKGGYFASKLLNRLVFLMHTLNKYPCMSHNNLWKLLAFVVPLTNFLTFLTDRQHRLSIWFNHAEEKRATATRIRIRAQTRARQALWPRCFNLCQSNLIRMTLTSEPSSRVFWKKRISWRSLLSSCRIWKCRSWPPTMDSIVRIERELGFLLPSTSFTSCNHLNLKIVGRLSFATGIRGLPSLLHGGRIVASRPSRRHEWHSTRSWTCHRHFSVLHPAS